MKENRIKRFYIMPEVWVTVTQSQVFNWIKLVNERGISTDCISITDKRTPQDDVRKIEESIKGEFIQIHDFKRLLVSDIYTFLMLFKFYLKNVVKYDKIIYQTRIGIGTVFLILNWLPKVKLVFEARGAGNEEIAHSEKEIKETYIKRIKRRISIFNEKLLLNKSDKIICVSKALRDYYVTKFKLNYEAFSVFPGAADSDYFFYDKEVRNSFREKLNFSKKDIVIVYSGRLEMKWEIPDKIFDFFKVLNSNKINYKLLLITPDVAIAKELIKEYNLEGLVFVLAISFKDVNKYLNASDVGLLLREDVVMNNVASPTKFAEYLMAGLPVIISAAVHDFAETVKSTEFGVVVNGLAGMTNNEYKQLEKSLTLDRNAIATWGLRNLSKRTFIEKYLKLLKTI